MTDAIVGEVGAATTVKLTFVELTAGPLPYAAFTDAFTIVVAALNHDVGAETAQDPTPPVVGAAHSDESANGAVVTT